MKKVEFSALVKRKITSLKRKLESEFGSKVSKDILNKLLGDADRLSQFEKSGVNISATYDIETDYWYIFTCHHYLIYRIEQDRVIIVQMFHERQDFMMKLFGISGRTLESIDYWGE